tara:strand:+ start:7862 stop:9835 length:1974 start_codon:yes stop_codon:yes gene_type:complete
MFKKILVANRGEIACRVIKTCKELGIATVSVYSDADSRSLHVTMADQAINIGPAPSSASYLVIDKIIRACKKTGADAVHPGYGFLSENAAFVNQLEREGIKFIGPPSEPIRVMGDKIESKIFAEKSGVNIIPGHQAIIKDSKEAIEIAKKIGFPVMVKASAGGGGKGMRIAEAESEVEDAFNSSVNEAKSSFGDDRIFIEKFIEKPRHIEIQILADNYGNVIHLGERECSIQRRNQKIIEESPSSFVDSSLRNEMGEQAKRLASTINYTSAGTVEFIVDQNKNFYFLEMNTRLQVEHPVTELVTGVDLVEEMIKIAAGEELKLKQEDIKFNGWAIESRIYAEDPERNFMPSTGRLKRYIVPENINSIRNDTGVYEGGEISIYYDPMISKLCSYGKDRNDALNTMEIALNNHYIDGIRNNIDFLTAIVRNKRFISGDINTGFIDQEYKHGFKANINDKQFSLLFSIAATYFFTLDQFRSRNQNDRSMIFEKSLVAVVEKEIFKFKTYDKNDNLIIEFNDEVITIDSNYELGNPIASLMINGKDYSFKVERIINGYKLSGYGFSSNIKIYSSRAFELSKHMIEKNYALNDKIIRCPMPGLVISIDVVVGQEVSAGDKLCTIEAMKMENVIRSESSGIIKKILCNDGDSLASDQTILEFS